MDDLDMVLEEMRCQGWEDRGTGEAAAELERRLETFAATGEVWAEARMAQWRHEGARRQWKTWLDRARRVWLAPNGRQISTPAHYSIAQRSPVDGAKTGRFREVQLALMTWAEVHEKRTSLMAQRNRLAEAITVFDLLITLEQKYPHESPYEAMLLDGIDPDQAVINLSKIA